jgi:hypothetical protein
MTDHQDHDTEAAPTEQASPPTTELPPANHAAATPEAWSLDDTAEVDSDSPRRGRLVSVGLVGLVVVVAGALIYLAATLFGSGSSKHVEPSAKPSTTVPVAAPTPPPAVTATAAPAPPPAVEPPAPPPTPALSGPDARFITDLHINGMFPPDEQAVIGDAHLACQDLANGASNANTADRLRLFWPGIHLTQVVWFVDTASAIYCPQIGGDV